MKRTSLILATALAAAVLVGPPAFAKAKKSAKPSVSCKEIKDAIASGKTSDDVQKEKNVTAARVKSCTAPAHHRRHRTAKKS